MTRGRFSCHIFNQRGGSVIDNRLSKVNTEVVSGYGIRIRLFAFYGLLSFWKELHIFLQKLLLLNMNCAIIYSILGSYCTICAKILGNEGVFIFGGAEKARNYYVLIDWAWVNLAIFFIILQIVINSFLTRRYFLLLFLKNPFNMRVKRNKQLLILNDSYRRQVLFYPLFMK